MQRYSIGFESFSQKEFFWLFSQKKFAGKEKVVIFAARFDRNGSYLTILKDKYKQVPRKFRESRALISLKKSVRTD
jgi:hypothetical protein